MIGEYKKEYKKEEEERLVAGGKVPLDKWVKKKKNNMHPGQNAAPGGATAQPQRCALTKKTCTSHPLPKITPPFTRRSSMYILLSAHNPWFTPPSCTVSVYTVNSNSVPLSGSSAEHTL